MKKYGIYYDITYAPVSRLSTLRALLYLEVKRNRKINQMYTRTEFIDAVLDDAVYLWTQQRFYQLITLKNDLIYS